MPRLARNSQRRWAWGRAGIERRTQPSCWLGRYYPSDVLLVGRRRVPGALDPRRQRRGHQRDLRAKCSVEAGVPREVVGPAARNPAAAFVAQGATQSLQQSMMGLWRQIVQLARPDRQQPGQIAAALIGGKRGAGPQGQRAWSRFVGRAVSGHAGIRSVIATHRLTVAWTGDKYGRVAAERLAGNAATRHVGPTGRARVRGTKWRRRCSGG